MTVSPGGVLGRVEAWIGRWRPLLPLMLAEFVVLLGFGALLPILPLYVAEQGIDVPLYGLITAAWAIAKLFSEPLFGYLADRSGLRKPLMLVGLVLLALFTVLPLVFTGAAALFVLRLLSGAAAGMYEPAARGMIVDATDEGERGEAFGLYTAFQMGGFLVGPVIGAFAAHLGGGFAFPFVLTGVMTIAAAAYLFMALPSRLAAVSPVRVRAGEGPRPAAVTAPAATGELDESPAPLRALLNRPMLAAVVMYFGISLTFGVYEVIWTLYMLRLGASLEWVGATFMFFGLGVLIASPFAGRIVDRFGPIRFVVLGSGMIAVSGVVYAVATEPGLPTAVVPFEAVAEAFVIPALFALVAQGTPRGRSSTAQGIFGASGTVALIIASLATGVLWARDPSLPFWFFIIGVVVCLAGGLLIYGLRRERDVGLDRSLSGA